MKRDHSPTSPPSFERPPLASHDNMATDFDSLLAERTKNGAASVHGVMIKCIDKQGLPPLSLPYRPYQG